MYAFYRHRHDSGRELVLSDGAQFPHHLNSDDWYLHGIHASVNGRTEADIGKLGFCDRNGSAPFGRRVAAHARAPLIRGTL
ncbi:MAG TPA: hypothetical protein VHU23_17585 [Rhizomicrobium sp.]|jgi:hypothetical protein|nr:hypothetical protein [Rhizomicrobium sp.]